MVSTVRGCGNAQVDYPLDPYRRRGGKEALGTSIPTGSLAVRTPVTRHGRQSMPSCERPSAPP